MTDISDNRSGNSACKTKYRYARIIIDISHEKVDRAFTYRIPESLSDKIEVGLCVNIPFGKGDKVRTGYVVELTDHADYEESKIKEIIEIAHAENGMDQRLVALSAWMKHRYGCTMIQALKTVLPVRKKVGAKEEKEVTLLISTEEAMILRREAFLKHQSAKVRLLDALIGGATVQQKMLTGALRISAATISSLQKQGILKVETTREFRNPIRFEQSQKAEISLTDRQKEIAEDYLTHYDAGNRQPALLHGITGSGKTEVYMEIIDGILQRGKEVIVLIPEIALTYQTVRRFYRRFGEKISILNSRLSAGERYDQIERVKKGEVKIMIGPRSALFTPFPNPGLILIDEEHETSYKSETMPRYHAREVAARICEMTGAGLFLGSATPSLDSYYQAEKGRYRLYQLTERIGEAVLPSVEIVDLRKELAQGNFSMFSKALGNAMDVTLARGEQIMLFLNRRGIAGFVSCKSCGEVLKCPHCDVSLSEHRNKMICHYCGYETAKVKTCPACGSPYIYGMKAGTQQVEELLQKRYPNAKILRMDADTTKKKEDYDTILAAFSQHEADILVGTQMIVKGHDFPDVTLVGVLAADQSLFAADYTAPERTF
ncbi:MAG: primosomal protein N', partial [Lachnospiraceae bacterium]|nr:primosomal protein N' [Lachnospiraceae bacterium]